ncbi:MAG TPA: TMEM175 family protein [Magnetospirillaceae bacterium]|jgi:uncharacterized membrane protein
MYPKNRLDALNDGIYGVAMTLLVLDVRIPDDAHIATNHDLIAASGALWGKLLPYVISFFVLGSGWLSAVRIRSDGEMVGKSYAKWWLWQLLLVTCVPATTIAMGRFTDLWFADVLYAVNLGVLALCGHRMLMTIEDVKTDIHYHDRRISLILLMASCILVGVLAPFLKSDALYAFLINFLSRPILRWIGPTASDS